MKAKLKTNRIRTPAAPPARVLRSRDEVAFVLNEIVGATLNRNRAQLTLDACIAALRERHEPQIAACNESIAEQTALIQAWAESHPEEFGKLKSIDFSNAQIGFRKSTPTLKTRRGWTWDKVLDAIRRLRSFTRYIRVKEEVNKQTLLVDRDSLDLEALGLRVVHAESFYIDPKIDSPENKITETTQTTNTHAH